MFTLGCFVFSGSPVSAAVADNFIYPLSSWNVTTEHGDTFSSGYYHMGVDAGFEFGSGGPVYATADGVVVDVAERSQFGLVILIEHERPSKNIVSLYGHLRPSVLMVSEGDRVEAGDQIGVLGCQADNGGWTPHLHFGIHKSAYSGEWVYYGHVTDLDTQDDWYDPEVYIPNHLIEDKWDPEVSWSVEKGDVIGDGFATYVYASDLGSGVQSLKIEASDDGKKTWETITTATDGSFYPYLFSSYLSEFDDGKLYLRATAKDGEGRSTTDTTYVQKKWNASYTRVAAVMSGAPSYGAVKTYYQTGDEDEAFRVYKKTWEGGGDVAVGDVTGNGANNIVTLKGAGDESKVHVLTRKGTKLNNFKAFPAKRKNGGSIATGDIDADGVDEIIVGSGPGQTVQVRAYERNGTLLWKKQPFKKAHKKGVDVAAGDVDGDGVDEVVVGLSDGLSKVTVLSEDGKRGDVSRVFKKSYRGGVNVAAGDVDDDGKDEIIIGSGGDKKGVVRVMELSGYKKDRKITPFGSGFTGPVDVSVVDWEEDGKDEILVSQAGDGEAWVKVYRYTKAKTVLFNERVFAEGFEGGARISGWK